jgi:hypothetical protein
VSLTSSISTSRTSPSRGRRQPERGCELAQVIVLCQIDLVVCFDHGAHEQEQPAPFLFRIVSEVAITELGSNLSG